MLQNVSFGASPLKILRKTTKTPRAFTTQGLTKVLRELGYNYKSTTGSHHKFQNSNGDVFVFSAAHKTVDPKTVKQVQKLIERNN